MRHEQLPTRVRVYLTGDEVVKLIEHAPHRKAAVAIWAMFEALLRVGTLAEEVGPHRLAEKDDGTKYLIVDAKHTVEGEPEDRRSERVISQGLYDAMQDIAHSEDVLFDEEDRTIRDWVYDAAESARRATGEPGWDEVSPHDLRRSGANWLNANGADKNYIQQQGDWKDQENMDPYLDSIPLEQVADELERVGFVGDGPQTPEDRVGRIEVLVEEQMDLLIELAKMKDIDIEQGMVEKLEHDEFTGDTRLSAFADD